MIKETRIISVVQIRRPIQDVFKFGSTPRFWPMWHPTAQSVTGAIDHPVQVGDEISEQERFAFLHGSMQWRVRESEAPTRWTIDGVLEDVPLFKGTSASVTYTLTFEDGKTHLERDMSYRVPNLLSRLLDRLYFRKHNAEQSQLAVDRMKLFLESESPRI